MISNRPRTGAATYRPLCTGGGAAGLGSEEARSAARTALSAIRRGFNFVPTRWTVQALRDLGRFRRTTPVCPAAAVAVRRRTDLVAADASATGGD